MNSTAPRTQLWAHSAYIAAIAWKGFDGFLEFSGGVIAAIFGPSGVQRLVDVTAPEVGSHLHAIAFFHRSFISLEHTLRFVIAYLLVHGALKFWLAIALLRQGQLWTFPLAGAVFSGFVAYMGYRLALHWSWWLFVFIAFDIVTIGLIFVEWDSRRTRDRSATSK